MRPAGACSRGGERGLSARSGPGGHVDSGPGPGKALEGRLQPASRSLPGAPRAEENERALVCEAPQVRAGGGPGEGAGGETCPRQDETLGVRSLRANREGLPALRCSMRCVVKRAP